MNEPFAQPASTASPRSAGSFIARNITPENRLAEVICGLVMVLSFTAATGGVLEGTSPNALLVAILGCNIAWGIVDGATYILGNLLNRGARARLITAVKRDSNDSEAASEIAGRIEATVGEFLTRDQRNELHRWVLDGATRLEADPVRVKRTDIYTAIACFMIVFGATLPVLIPFLLIENDALALRASNLLILAMLFAIGWRWARFAGTNRWVTGAVLMSLGLVLVAITILLGG